MGANLLISKTFGPFDHLVGSCRTWLLARDAWRRLSDLLAEPAGAMVPPETSAEPGLVVLGASLRAADGKPLLDDVDLHITPGTLAVVSGRNGSGKTTLLRLLAGVIPPSRGAILLDGNPVGGGPVIGYLPQSVSLLDGTVVGNIGRLQDDLPGVIAAARQAAVHEQIGRMSGGYETTLSGNGSTLSGGMRQRIGLARALFGTPRLLLLDEPDASLDSAGSDALLNAIRHCCATGAIAVVISHRPALLQAADLVIEMEGGRVAAVRRPVRNAPPKLEIA